MKKSALLQAEVSKLKLDLVDATAAVTEERNRVLDQLKGQLLAWRENNVVFREEHIEGTRDSSHLAFALMADERRFALDEVLLKIERLRK